MLRSGYSLLFKPVKISFSNCILFSNDLLVDFQFYRKLKSFPKTICKLDQLFLLLSSHISFSKIFQHFLSQLLWDIQVIHNCIGIVNSFLEFILSFVDDGHLSWKLSEKVSNNNLVYEHEERSVEHMGCCARVCLYCSEWDGW